MSETPSETWERWVGGQTPIRFLTSDGRDSIPPSWRKVEELVEDYVVSTIKDDIFQDAPAEPIDEVVSRLMGYIRQDSEVIQAIEGARIFWICYGTVRGWCGVKHRTLEACQEHIQEDERWARKMTSGKGYSDRQPVQFVNGRPQPREGHIYPPEIPHYVWQEMGLR